MPNNTDLILSMNSTAANEWDNLTRYDVDTLLKESQKRIDEVVKQVQAMPTPTENKPKEQ